MAFATQKASAAEQSAAAASASEKQEPAQGEADAAEVRLRRLRGQLLSDVLRWRSLYEKLIARRFQWWRNSGNRWHLDDAEGFARRFGLACDLEALLLGSDDCFGKAI